MLDLVAQIDRLTALIAGANRKYLQAARAIEQSQATFKGEVVQLEQPEPACHAE